MAEHHLIEPISVASAPAHRIGDQLVGFTVLLPARPGRIGLLVDPMMAESLRRRFPEAIDLDPEAPEHVSTLIVDDRLHRAPHPMTENADTIVRIGRRGTWVLYPASDHPQMLWRSGWPQPSLDSPLARMRQAVGLRCGRVCRIPRIEITGVRVPSLAGQVTKQIAAAFDEELRLVGVCTAGHTILRLRGASRDIAVRLSCTNPESEVMPSSTIIEELPDLADHVPAQLLRGRTDGYPWVASEWFPSPVVPQTRAGSVSARRRDVIEQVTRVLEASPTGATDAGWAHSWIAPVALVPEELAASFEQVLSLLEDGLPTGWCHGDPWPGNVLLSRHDAKVIDWDNADRDAPLGIDRLLAAALRRVGEAGESMAQACVLLVGEPHLLSGAVGGRDWSCWDPQTRAALALSAFLLHLRNRDLHDIGVDGLHEDLETMSTMCREVFSLTAVPDAPAVPGSARGSAIRGALWLGIGATTVKACQTVVLLALAAILAPSALGLLAVGSLVLNVSAALTDLGSSTALVHWRGRAEEAARSALSVALGLSLVLTTGLWMLAPTLARVLNVGTDGASVIRGLLLALPFAAVAGVSGELLRRDFAFVRRVIPDIVSAILGAGIAFWLALTGHGVFSLVVGQVIQSMTSMLLCWFMRPPVRPGWRTAHVRALIAYGGHLAGANLVQLLMLNVDYVLVAHFLGAGPLGQYSLAFRLAYMPHLLVAVVVGGAVFPYMCRMGGSDLGRATASFGTATLAVLMPMYLGLALLAPQIQLLGTKWAPAVPVLRWLALYGLLLSVVRMCMVPLNAIGRPKDSFVFSALHLVLLAAVLGLVTSRGIVWVAIGQGIGVLGVAVLVARSLEGHVPGFRLAAVGRGLAPVVGASAVMALVITAGQWLFPWSRVSVPGLMLIGTLAVLTYLAALLAARPAQFIRIATQARGR